MECNRYVSKNRSTYSNMPYWLADASLASKIHSNAPVWNPTKSGCSDCWRWVLPESSASITLARAGLKVVVLEGGRLGEGASCRNGGLLGPSFQQIGRRRTGAPIRSWQCSLNNKREFWWRLIGWWTSSKKNRSIVICPYAADFVAPVILAITLT